MTRRLTGKCGTGPRTLQIAANPGRRFALALFNRCLKDEPARFSDGVRVVFFNAQGDTVSTLRAERGEINASGDDMKVFESVVVVARDCTQLQTDSLRWQRDENRIMGEGHVTISRPDGIETGVGFNASSDLKKWTLLFVNTRMRRKKP